MTLKAFALTVGTDLTLADWGIQDLKVLLVPTDQRGRHAEGKKENRSVIANNTICLFSWGKF